jgi:hypothetical protein
MGEETIRLKRWQSTASGWSAEAARRRGARRRRAVDRVEEEEEEFFFSPSRNGISGRAGLVGCQVGFGQVSFFFYFFLLMF